MGGSEISIGGPVDIKLIENQRPRLTVKQVTVVESQQMGALLIGVERITSLIGRCQIYEALYLKRDVEHENWKKAVLNLTSALVTLYATLLSFIGSAIRAYNQGIISRTLDAILNPSKVIGFLDKCHTLENDVAREVDNCEHVLRVGPEEYIQKLKQTLDNFQTPILRIDSRVAALHERLNISERLSILEWISEIRHEENHFFARHGRTSGTGEWLLRHEKYRDWRTSSTSMILWLHGDREYNFSLFLEEFSDKLNSWCWQNKARF